ncbi:hypothetical protein HDU76_012484 [Blyttiomyces sp. JEL0837]|nr:hypothetical protein HDU76_012484 [Blyttiomyces sp. JEL0837]
MDGLKSVVEDTLKKKGVLGKLKAELRASVFSVLQEVESGTEGTSNQTSQTSSKQAQMALSLIREFLEFHKMHFTLSVLEPESPAGEKVSLQECIAELDLSRNASKPLLLQLIESHLNQGFKQPAGTARSAEDTSGFQSSSTHGKTNAPNFAISRSLTGNNLDSLELDPNDVKDDEIEGSVRSRQRSESDFVTSDRTITRSNSTEFPVDFVETINP